MTTEPKKEGVGFVVFCVVIGICTLVAMYVIGLATGARDQERHDQIVIVGLTKQRNQLIADRDAILATQSVLVATHRPAEIRVTLPPPLFSLRELRDLLFDCRRSGCCPRTAPRCCPQKPGLPAVRAGCKPPAK